MKNIIVYDDNCSCFSASNYDVLFQRFRQVPEYDYFLEMILDSILTGKVSDKPYMNAIVEECQNKIKKQLKEYEFQQKNNNKEELKRLSKIIWDTIDGTIAFSDKSVACFQQYYKKCLKEIYFFDY